MNPHFPSSMGPVGRRAGARTWAQALAAGLATALVWGLPPAQAQAQAQAAAPGAGLAFKTCRLPGVPHLAQCAVLQRPLDPTQPGGKTIDLHVAVLPALARNKKPDPVFFFAGGPGQSAIDLAGPVSSLLGRFLNRRDLVLVDQRGTGRSAPLYCEPESPGQSLAEATDGRRADLRLQSCREQLSRLPHGDLRQYVTPIAMADVDAVRQAMGLAHINLVGGSYGTRAALEYLRQFPQRVRRVVIDGVAPPDMVLPMAFSTDGQAALEQVLSGCEADGRCNELYPRLRADWQALMRSLPREVRALHPVTGQDQAFRLTRDQLSGLVRLPLYAPALASALPYAITEAQAGRFTPLVGLTSAMASGPAMRLAVGMHHAVVCSEDLPRVAQGRDVPGADFGDAVLRQYQQACEGWPRAALPADFYRIPASPVPVLVLSGGADPVTPPRHGERVRQALGAQARHLVVPQAGHGTISLPCMRDVVFRFIDAADDTAALSGLAEPAAAACGATLPRPPAFAPVQPRVPPQPQEAQR